MKEYAQLKLDNQLCHRLYMASNNVTRRYRPHLDELDLTYSQYLVMMMLWEQDEVLVSQITQKTRIDAGALTLILKKLTDKDYLSVSKDDHDQRKRIVKLTAEGKALQDKAAHIPEQILCQFPHMTKAELQQLMALLDKVNMELLS